MTNVREDRCGGLVPGRQRPGRHHRFAQDLGGHGRLQGARSTSIKADVKAAVASRSRRCRRIEGAGRHDWLRLRHLPRGLPREEGLIPQGWLAEKTRRRPGILGGVGAAIFGWVLSAPVKLDRKPWPAWEPGDATRGQAHLLCRRLHLLPRKPGSQGDARLQLMGGLELKTPFGTFVPPNISQDPNDGIGAWSLEDSRQCHAEGRVAEGRAPVPGISLCLLRAHEAGRHCRPLCLPEDAAGRAGKAPSNSTWLSLQHPSRIGLWKLLYLSDEPAVAFADGTPDRDGLDAIWSKGQAIAANATRRASLAGGTNKNQWLAGAVAAEGERRRAEHHTRRRGRSVAGRRATSPTISKPALRRISIPWAAPWSTSRRTWPN
jgi:hypothetical protein